MTRTRSYPLLAVLLSSSFSLGLAGGTKTESDTKASAQKRVEGPRAGTAAKQGAVTRETSSSGPRGNSASSGGRATVDSQPVERESERVGSRAGKSTKSGKGSRERTSRPWTSRGGRR